MATTQLLSSGKSAAISGLTSRPELNGTRVTVEKWLEDRARWRVCRADTGEKLGVKALASLRSATFGNRWR